MIVSAATFAPLRIDAHLTFVFIGSPDISTCGHPGSRRHSDSLMPLEPGDLLGPYEILSPLGAGGMGEVYRARDTRLGREVAIKVLPAALASDPERLKRFEREARSASSLNHPNIVTIYDIGADGGVSYIAMELVNGEPLRAASRTARCRCGAFCRSARRSPRGWRRLTPRASFIGTSSPRT